MLNNIAIWVVKCFLKKDLTIGQRNILTTCVLDNLDALPIAEIITVSDEGEVLINNRSLDIEKAKQLRESARLVLDNVSFKVMKEQVLFTAVTGGLHNATSSDHLYFYRAAIWFGQQLEKQLKILAQRIEE